MNVQTLIDKAGGDREFRELCGVARTTVLDWKREGRIPANRVAEISAKLELPLSEVITLASTPRVKSPVRQSQTPDDAGMAGEAA